MNLTAFISAFVGACLGFLSAAFLSWFNSLSGAKLKLRDRLELHRLKVWRELSDQAPDLDLIGVWREELERLWPLYNAVIDVLPVWCRTKYVHAWRVYRGVDAEMERELPSHTAAPRSKAEFLRRIDEMLKIFKA